MQTRANIKPTATKSLVIFLARGRLGVLKPSFQSLFVLVIFVLVSCFDDFGFTTRNVKELWPQGNQRYERLIKFISPSTQTNK